jgi:ABC-type transport system involved in cytochrome c biogenesis permease subunit
MRRAIGFGVVGLAALALLLQARPASPASDGMRLGEFGKIPVVHNGRVKPMDTLARTLLKIISERESFKDEEGHSQPAIRWLLDVLVDELDPQNRARRNKVFRIVDVQLLSSLGLRTREGFRYSIEEFGSALPKLGPSIQQARAKKEAEKPLDPFDRQLLKLETSLGYYESLARFTIPHMVPPAAEGGKWMTLPEAMQHAQTSLKGDLRAQALVRILEAYSSGAKDRFNQEVEKYLAEVQSLVPAESQKASVESFFNRVDPFNLCRSFYFIAFVLSCLAWLFWTRPLGHSAFALVAFTLVVHTVALVTRMYLSGRPPVTNLYSSAIFIGWGMVILGLVLERFYRLGVGTTLAAVAGFVTLLIADILAADGDTMEVLQAVLDTQFWLATHVTCITLGYATTFVAGLLGLIYILRGIFTSSLTADMRLALSRMIYGTVCFATFFSFVGTVLGGLWADDSWGRFWGWDPKENGALMIVLWNALLLHARWGGMVRDRGLAVLAVLGNIVVSWSWFGVNELGVGLHSYGFTEGRMMWLFLFMLSQVAVAGLGMISPRLWRSPLPARGAHRDQES